MSVSNQLDDSASGGGISPRLAGIIVVIGVVAMPGIPVGYLTPAAVFLGALTVFVMEGRRYRRHGVEAFKAEGRQIVEAGRKSSEVPEASGAAFASRKMD